MYSHADCPDAATESGTVAAGEAQALLNTVCRSYNETYEEPGLCDGAWEYITFFQGTTELAATRNLSCGESMSEALEALNSFEDAL